MPFASVIHLQQLLLLSWLSTGATLLMTRHPVYHFSCPRTKWEKTVAISSNLKDDDNHDDPFDRFSLGKLQSRIDQQQNQYRDLFSDENVDCRPENVHIIVFHPGTTQQGVHAIEFPLGSGHNFILAFESQEDCDAFIVMLKQEGSAKFQHAIFAVSLLSELEGFCISATELFVKVVPRGKKLRPPSENVDEFALDPTLNDGEVEDINNECENWQ